MTSLRTAMSLALLAMLVAVGLVAGLLAYAASLHEAGQFMDDQMRQLAAMVDEGTTPLDAGALQEPEDRFAVTVWTAGRRRVVLAAPGADAEPATPGFADRTVRGEAWRTYARRDGARTVVVAQRLSAREETAGHAALMVALPILASAPLAWLVVTFTVRRLLRPLAIAGADIATRGARSPPAPSAPRAPDEIRPFVDAVDGLVERLRASLDQQRRFVADAAHQLRTPLAALRIQVDNLEGDGEPGAPRSATASLRALREGIERAAALTGQLLDLARLEGREREAAAEVDVAAVATQAVADRIVLAEAKGVDLGLAGMRPTVARLDGGDLATILANVLDNAVRHTPPGGRVDCALRHRPGSDAARLVVEDTGPGVPASDMARLTDRFHRGANASGDGSGLGLAIAKAAAERNGLSLLFAARPGGGLAVTVGIPLDGRRCAARAPGPGGTAGRPGPAG